MLSEVNVKNISPLGITAVYAIQLSVKTLSLHVYLNQERAFRAGRGSFLLLVALWTQEPLSFVRTLKN